MDEIAELKEMIRQLKQRISILESRFPHRSLGSISGNPVLKTTRVPGRLKSK